MNENTGGPSIPGVNTEEMRAYRELREKPFSELNTDQKIDRLVEEVRNLRYTTRRVAELDDKVRRLSKHDHVNGKVVVELGEHDHGQLIAPGISRDPLA